MFGLIRLVTEFIVPVLVILNLNFFFY